MLQPADTLIMETDMETEAGAAMQAPEYQILREIGRGGMSTVYEARDTRTGQSVALKMLALPPSHTQEQQRDLIARFRREARAVARLSHPNIVVIHEIGERAGEHFLAMEYLTGQTLREWAAGPLTPALAQGPLDQIASALDAVHAAGIIHRDVKPSNVLILPDGTAKLLDFGIARQSDDTTITSTGVLVGSPSYMAPEQVRGEAGTAASDVWALGVLLYEVLAGRPPFQGATIPAVLYQVTHEAPPPVPGLPRAAQKALRRALDKNPARRFRSAGAFAGAMRAALPKPTPDVLPTPNSLPKSAPHGAAPPAPLLRRWRWGALLPLLPLGIGAGFLIHRRVPAPAHTSAAAPVARPSPPASAIRRLPPATLGPAIVKKQSAPHRPPRPTRPEPHGGQPKRTALKLRPHAGQQGPSPLKPKPAHAPRNRRPPALVHRPIARRPSARRLVSHRLTAHRLRRVIPRYFRRPYRFTPRRSAGGYDAAAAAQLHRFIWPMGR